MSFRPGDLFLGLVLFVAMVYAPIRLATGSRRAGSVAAYWATETLGVKVFVVLGTLMFAWWVLWLVWGVASELMAALRRGRRD